MSNTHKNEVHVFASSFYKKLIGGIEDTRVGPMTEAISKAQYNRVR